MPDPIAPDVLAKIRRNNARDLKHAEKPYGSLDETAWERHILLAEVDRLLADYDRLKSGAHTAAAMASEITSTCMAAEAAIARVRALHAEVPYRPGYCYCANSYPCPTIRALDPDEGGEGRE